MFPCLSRHLHQESSEKNLAVKYDITPIHFVDLKVTIPLVLLCNNCMDKEIGLIKLINSVSFFLIREVER